VILVLLITFGLSAVLPVITALRRPGGFLHYSFLAGGVFLGQLFLQAVGVVRSADSVPHDGLVRELLMCTLSALAVYVAWELPVRRTAQPVRQYDTSAVFRISVVFIAIGMIGFFKLTQLSGGIVEHFHTTGHYALEWRGLPVVWVFFMAYLSPGIFLALFSSIREASALKYLVSAFPLAVNLSFILLLGRRAVLFETAIVIFGALWFTKRWTPPRTVLIAGAAFGTIAIYAAPYYRTYSQLGADNEKLRELDLKKTVSAPLNGMQEEFYNGAWTTDIVTRNHAFQHGAGIYNYVIASFIPKLIFSEQFKERLFLTSPQWDIETNDYNWHIAYGDNISGPASAYAQFWFLGFLWFYVLGRFMKRLYVRAMMGDLFAQCLYIGCLAGAMQSIGNFMYMVLNPLFMFAPVLYLSMELVAAGRAQRPFAPALFALGRLERT
jgi:hypothetical protein